MNKDIFVAKMAYEAMRTFCNSLGEKKPAFEDITPEVRAGLMAQVKFLSAVPLATADQLHDEWRRIKVAQGWMYDEERDDKKKTHPLMQSFSRLTQRQRMKSYILLAMFTTGMTHIGLKGEISDLK
jgi:hypothetical protein